MLDSNTNLEVEYFQVSVLNHSEKGDVDGGGLLRDVVDRSSQCLWGRIRRQVRRQRRLKRNIRSGFLHTYERGVVLKIARGDPTKKGGYTR